MRSSILVAPPPIGSQEFAALAIDRKADRLPSQLRSSLYAMEMAVGSGASQHDKTQTVTTILERVLRDRLLADMPHGLFTPCAEGYARRPLHIEPRLNFVIVIMVWGVGQEAPLHDHGVGCAEGVVEGELTVIPHKLIDLSQCGKYKFRPESPIVQPAGRAMGITPPDDYHKVANLGSKPAISAHVYLGQMNFCNVFTPDGDCYTKNERSLRYTPA